MITSVLTQRCCCCCTLMLLLGRKKTESIGFPGVNYTVLRNYGSDFPFFKLPKLTEG